MKERPSTCEPAQPKKACLPKEEAITQKTREGKHGLVQRRDCSSAQRDSPVRSENVRRARSSS